MIVVLPIQRFYLSCGHLLSLLFISRSFNRKQKWQQVFLLQSINLTLYRVSINYFPDYKHLLQENYVEYKYIFFTTT